MLWEKVANYGEYALWTRTDDSDRRIYVASKTKPSSNDGGYYSILTALRQKGIGNHATI